MSTEDVPGMNPQNNDDLHAGCWGEHKDGSLVYVLGTENNTVLFCAFDLSGKKPVEYRDALPLKAFQEKFTYNVTRPSSIRFTWHDKTLFPWDRVMKYFNQGVRPVSAKTLIEEANAVKRSRSKGGSGTKTGRTSSKDENKSNVPQSRIASRREEMPVKKMPKRKKVYTGVVPEEIEDAIDAIDELEGPETVIRKMARERGLMPSEISHADVAHRVDKEVPTKGLSIAQRMKNTIQSAIDKLRPGKGE